MKKDKPSKKKINPEIPESKIKDPIKKEEPPSPIVEALMEGFEKSIISSHPLISPFKQLADKPNPFISPDLVKALVDESTQELPPFSILFYYRERAIFFSMLVLELYGFSLHCADPEIWKIGTKEGIKEGIRTLESKIEGINTLLRELVPKDARKRKKAQFIRACKVAPRALVELVDEVYKPTLRRYLDPSYKGKKGKKKKDIKRFWESELKTPFPNKIYLDDRTEATISLSIIAYQKFCPYTQLAEIYYKYRKVMKPTKHPTYTYRIK